MEARRQVTVLFTDMVGFTTFSERSGEEAAYTLMRSLSKLMGESVREQGGIVQGFIRRRHHGGLWRTDEALPLLEQQRRRCSANGFFYNLRGAVETALALCKIIQGAESLKGSYRLIK